MSKERPIIMGADSVRALLDGRKTQTRRVIVPQPQHGWEFEPYHTQHVVLKPGERRPYFFCTVGDMLEWRCPYGDPGDRLWVRETFAIVPRTAYRASVGVCQTLRPDDPYNHDAAIYRACFDRAISHSVWRSPIHMPRWASRLILTITAVRVERLQDISEADALADGGWTYGACPIHKDPRGSYAALWDALNAKRGFPWSGNPFVWAITFDVRREGASDA